MQHIEVTGFYRSVKTAKASPVTAVAGERDSPDAATRATVAPLGLIRRCLSDFCSPRGYTMAGTSRCTRKQRQSDATAPPPERGFEPTSTLQTQNSSTWSDRIDSPRTDPSSRFWPFLAAETELAPVGAGFGPLFVNGGGTVSGLSDHLESTEKWELKLPNPMPHWDLWRGGYSGGFLIWLGEKALNPRFHGSDGHRSRLHPQSDAWPFGVQQLAQAAARQTARSQTSAGRVPISRGFRGGCPGGPVAIRPFRSTFIGSSGHFTKCKLLHSRATAYSL